MLPLASQVYIRVSYKNFYRSMCLLTSLQISGNSGYFSSNPSSYQYESNESITPGRKLLGISSNKSFTLRRVLLNSGITTQCHVSAGHSIVLKCALVLLPSQIHISLQISGSCQQVAIVIFPCYTLCFLDLLTRGLSNVIKNLGKIE